MKKLLVGGAVLTAFMVGCTTPPLLTATGCEVTDKDRTSRADSSRSDMRVYTTCGTFKVADTHYRQDSADIYGRIIVGKTYTIEYTGTREPSISRFPNIINIMEESRV